MHYWGKCAEKDYDEAIRLFRWAASLNDKDGMYYLGRAYEKGHGVEKCREIAIEWYKRSLERGCEEAEEALKRLEADV
ncbi:MAG: sel1 repeat family protein [Candidatus Coatesbacteria bacterium]|nr:sel1 repeat family protein [Candidatus Coatesbacteria bacterium]